MKFALSFGSDRVFFAACGVLALGMMYLAAMWPQGDGTRAPAPFGHATTFEQAAAAAKAGKAYPEASAQKAKLKGPF
jgi:hypothetical protein